MTKRRPLAILAVTLGVVAFVAVYQNCTGSHYRTADLSVSSAQVQTYIQDIQCSGLTEDTSSTAAIADMTTIGSEAGAQNFFVGAPGMGMGAVGIAANLDYGTLRSDQGGVPAQLYGNFILGSDGTATLVLGLSDTGVATATPTATATATPSTTSTASNQVVAELLAHKKVQAKANPIRMDATTCATTNPLNLTNIIAAYNDGTSGLQLATFSDDGFDMELNLQGSSTLHIHSDDVDSGSLQDTIQLQIYEVDSSSGQDSGWVGNVNLTQPSE